MFCQLSAPLFFKLMPLMLMFVFFIIEVVCGVKALRKEPV